MFYLLSINIELKRNEKVHLSFAYVNVERVLGIARALVPEVIYHIWSRICRMLFKCIYY